MVFKSLETILNRFNFPTLMRCKVKWLEILLRPSLTYVWLSNNLAALKSYLTTLCKDNQWLVCFLIALISKYYETSPCRANCAGLWMTCVSVKFIVVSCNKFCYNSVNSEGFGCSCSVWFNSVQKFRATLCNL